MKGTETMRGIRAEECINIVCAECGSNDVLLNAAVRWDMEAQEYIVANIFNDGHSCNYCDSGCRIKEVPA